MVNLNPGSQSSIETGTELWEAELLRQKSSAQRSVQLESPSIAEHGVTLVSRAQNDLDPYSRD
jgi:hypothetical protein